MWQFILGATHVRTVVVGEKVAVRSWCHARKGCCGEESMYIAVRCAHCLCGKQQYVGCVLVVASLLMLTSWLVAIDIGFTVVGGESSSSFLVPHM